MTAYRRHRNLRVGVLSLTDDQRAYHAKWMREKRASDPEFRERQREATRRWNEANPDKVLDQRRRTRRRECLRKFGLTETDYETMLVSQDGGCAICGSVVSGRKNDTALIVDHCHDTQKVRGLLCHPCNMILGFAKDSARVLEKAAAYIREMGGLGT